MRQEEKLSLLDRIRGTAVGKATLVDRYGPDIVLPGAACGGLCPVLRCIGKGGPSHATPGLTVPRLHFARRNTVSATAPVEVAGMRSLSSSAVSDAMMRLASRPMKAAKMLPR